MYLKYILHDFLQNLKKYGLSCWILLSFLYLFLLSLQLINGNSQQWITKLGLNQTADLFFKPSVTVDEVQMLVQKIEQEQLPLKVQIENLTDLLSTLSPDSKKLFLEELNINLLPKVTLAGHFDQYLVFEKFISTLQSNPLIDEVISAESQNNLLIELLSLIQSLANGFVFVSLGLSIVIGFIILKLINQKRAPEIQILKAVGSSNLFIIWPQLLFLGFTQIVAFLSAYTLLLLFINLIKTSAGHILWMTPLLEQIEYLSLNSTALNWIISFSILVLMSYLSSFYAIRTFVASYHRSFIFLLFTTLIATHFSAQANDSQLKKVENEMSLIKSQNKVIAQKSQSLSTQQERSKTHLVDMARFMHKLDSKLKYNLHDQTQWMQIKNQMKAQSHLSWLIHKGLNDIKDQSQELKKLNHQLARRQLKLKKLETQLSAQPSNLSYLFDPEKAYPELKMTIGTQELARLLKMNQSKETKATAPAPGVIVLNEYHPRIGHTLILEIKPNVHFIVSGLINKFTPKIDSSISANTYLGDFNLKKKKIELRFKNQPINLAWLESKGRSYEKP